MVIDLIYRPYEKASELLNLSNSKRRYLKDRADEEYARIEVTLRIYEKVEAFLQSESTFFGDEIFSLLSPFSNIDNNVYIKHHHREKTIKTVMLCIIIAIILTVLYHHFYVSQK